MTDKKLLTVFGATGNQGGSVIDVILADKALQEKYKVRGITRNVSSRSAKALSDKGIEMVTANLNDLDSLRTALRGSYSVFGVTNFWDKDVLSKKIEMQQGKNIFEACQAEGVIHYIFSTLPHASKLTNGELQHIDHFDGKAMVAEYIESQKGKMIVSYFMPAMYLKSYKDQIMLSDDSPKMFMPIKQHDNQHTTWPVLDARGDSGKYVVGLLEAGDSANGVRVHGVSAWTTSQKLLEAINKVSGQNISYHEVTPETLLDMLPAQLAQEITETMQLVVDFGYYGFGEEESQAVHNAWLYNGQKTLNLEKLIEGGKPWEFQQKIDT